MQQETWEVMYFGSVVVLALLWIFYCELAKYYKHKISDWMWLVVVIFFVLLSGLFASRVNYYAHHI